MNQRVSVADHMRTYRAVLQSGPHLLDILSGNADETGEEIVKSCGTKFSVVIVNSSNEPSKWSGAHEASANKIDVWYPEGKAFSQAI